MNKYNISILSVSENSFMTSLEVIKEVMNVPMDAIHAIARMNGISTADNHVKTISEEELLPFIEAFERKIRHFFVNSIRNSAQMSSQELQLFTEFCKTFKKEKVSLDEINNWSQISKTKLREHFVDKIKEKTTLSLSNHHTLFEFLMGHGGKDAMSSNDIFRGIDVSRIIGEGGFVNLSSCSTDYYVFSVTQYRKEYPQYIIDKITITWQYRASLERNRDEHLEYVLENIRHIIISARYYVYVDEDNDHQEFTVSNNGHHDFFINSIYRMVA